MDFTKDTEVIYPGTGLSTPILQQSSVADECLDELAVRRLFVFLKENLNFEDLQDEFINRNLLSEKECKEYVFIAHGKHYRNEKFLKLMIVKKKCNAFVACMQSLPCHEHINEKIREFQNIEIQAISKDDLGTVPPCSVTDELLQKHFLSIYIEIEPCVVAEKMFKDGHITSADNDNVKVEAKKHKQLEKLMEILKQNKLHAQFLCTLECLQHASLLKIITTDIHWEKRQCSSLEKQLDSGTDGLLPNCFYTLYTKLELGVVVDEMFQRGHISVHEHDIVVENPKKYKRLKCFLKILKIKKLYAQFVCILQSLQIFSVLKAIETERLVENSPFEYRLCIQHNFTTLQIELPDYESVTIMMEHVLSVSDITLIQCCSGSIRQKSKMLKILIMKGEHACKKLFETIEFDLGRKDLTLKMTKKSHDLKMRGTPDLISNRSFLTSSCLQTCEQFLYDELEPLLLCDLLFEESAVDILSHDKITETNHRQKQIKCLLETLKENENNCFQVFLYILQRENYHYILKVLEDPSLASTPVADGYTYPLETAVQDQHLCLAKPNTDGEISKSAFIKQNVIIHKNQLLIELEPKGIISALSKLLLKSVLDSIPVGCGSSEKVERILSLIENGSTDVVKKFVTVLNDLGYEDIVNLVDPKDIKVKAENVREKMTTNYKFILDEMQLTLAKETLSKCNGNVEEISQKLSPANGNRKHRMNIFLQFILRDDINVIELERTLKSNGLEKCLPIDEIPQAECTVYHHTGKYAMPETMSRSAWKDGQYREKKYVNKDNSIISLPSIVSSMTETFQTTTPVTGINTEDKQKRSSYSLGKYAMSGTCNRSPWKDKQVKDRENVNKDTGPISAPCIASSMTNTPQTASVNNTTEKQKTDSQLSGKYALPETMRRSTGKDGQYNDKQNVNKDTGPTSEPSIVSCMTDTPQTITAVIGKNTTDKRKTGSQSSGKYDRLETMSRSTRKDRQATDRQNINRDTGPTSALSSVSNMTDTPQTITAGTGNHTEDKQKRSSYSSDEAKNTRTWTRYVESPDLKDLLASFCIKIPEDPDNLSFVKEILEESKLFEFVEDVKDLAKRIVLYKNLKDEDKKPGAVNVYEIIAENIDNQLLNNEKDAERKLEFFQRKNHNLIKVILIQGCFHSVLETKKKVYKKYQQFFKSERFHLQHVTEQYNEVAKLSAHRKIVSYKQYVESVRDSIPLQNIENIVKDAVNRAFSLEIIAKLCFDAVIQESGNAYSNHYYCRSIFTVHRLKQELKNKTVESVIKYLGSIICNDLGSHIKTGIQSRLSINIDFIMMFVNFAIVLVLGGMITTILFIVNPHLAVLASVMSFASIGLFAVDVNSKSWRRDEANEIYKEMNENKEKIFKELLKNIRNRCQITVDHLNIIVEQLENFRSRIHLNDLTY